MNPNRKVLIGQIDTGEWFATATMPPYFCIVADTQEEMVKQLKDIFKNGYNALVQNNRLAERAYVDLWQQNVRTCDHVQQHEVRVKL